MLVEQEAGEQTSRVLDPGQGSWLLGRQGSWATGRGYCTDDILARKDGIHQLLKIYNSLLPYKPKPSKIQLLLIYGAGLRDF